MADILVIDDEASLASVFEQFLLDAGHQVRVASSAADGLAAIADRQPDVVFMDIRMPGRSGLEALQEMRARFPQVDVVMMTAYGTSQTSIDAIRTGAFDYLTKPLDLGRLRTVLAKALAARQVRQQGDGEVPDSPADAAQLIGDTPAMVEVYKLIGRLSTNDVPALLVGERGTGKRAVTRAVHANSARAGRPFTIVDCASMPESMLEAALFGAGDGTVFVGAIERMPVALQTRLAHALSTPGVRAATAPRVFGACERDPAEFLRSGTLTRELYDVLSIITLRLPPLRERRDDIVALVRYFIMRANNELNRTIRGVDDAVLRRMQEYAWPGNVAELERVVKRACIIAQADVITLDEVTGSLTGAPIDRAQVESALAQATRAALHERLVESAAATTTRYHDIVELVETTLVKEALAITSGNQVKASELLGVNRATLRKKVGLG
jgi:DNA-binding NtrC family response regulator